MIALKTKINDVITITSGREDLGTLSFSLVVVMKPYSKKKDNIKPEYYLDIGGTTDQDKVQETTAPHWLRKDDFKVGDKIFIEIIEADSADPPISEDKIFPDEETLKERWKDAKEFYEKYKNDYENI